MSILIDGGETLVWINPKEKLDNKRYLIEEIVILWWIFKWWFCFWNKKYCDFIDNSIEKSKNLFRSGDFFDLRASVLFFEREKVLTSFFLDYDPSKKRLDKLWKDLWWNRKVYNFIIKIKHFLKWVSFGYVFKSKRTNDVVLIKFEQKKLFNWIVEKYSDDYESKKKLK